MAQIVYAFTSDNGDGSSSVCFTRDDTLLAKLEESDPQSYGGNEGSALYLTFPDDLDLEEAGFSFMTADDIDPEDLDDEGDE
jgi:hypothetical protein